MGADLISASDAVSAFIKSLPQPQPLLLMPVYFALNVGQDPVIIGVEAGG